MSSKEFKALIIKEKNGKYIREIGKRNINDLPAGDVLISVKYSSLNYKDALSAIGNKGVTRTYPHTPGIDAAGLVEESHTDKFKEGDKVIVTGFDLGMNTPGGFGEFISVPADWVVKLPDNLTLKESMIYGTAGFTAALSLYRLEHTGLKKSDGDILVTGATGGVGSLAVAILSHAGYDVTAATGKSDKEEYLKKLGASSVITREFVDDSSGKPLLPTRWAGVVDTVGGNILSAAVRSTKHGGGIAACGLTQSPNLNLTVYPFILRGVNLMGIDSAHCQTDVRLQMWNNLAGKWKPELLDDIGEICGLENISGKIDKILEGKITGRTVIDLSI